MHAGDSWRFLRERTTAGLVASLMPRLLKSASAEQKVAAVGTTIFCGENIQETSKGPNQLFLHNSIIRPQQLFLHNLIMPSQRSSLLLRLAQLEDELAASKASSERLAAQLEAENARNQRLSFILGQVQHGMKSINIALGSAVDEDINVPTVAGSSRVKSSISHLHVISEEGVRFSPSLEVINPPDVAEASEDEDTLDGDDFFLHDSLDAAKSMNRLRFHHLFRVKSNGRAKQKKRDTTKANGRPLRTKKKRSGIHDQMSSKSRRQLRNAQSRSEARRALLFSAV